MTDQEEVHTAFICPISGLIMNDPVIDPEGNTYEKQYILEWLSRKQISPITRNLLNPSMLSPNRALKELINAYKNRTETISTTATTTTSPSTSSIPITSIRLNITIPYMSIIDMDYSIGIYLDRYNNIKNLSNGQVDDIKNKISSTVISFCNTKYFLTSAYNLKSIIIGTKYYYVVTKSDGSILEELGSNYMCRYNQSILIIFRVPCFGKIIENKYKCKIKTMNTVISDISKDYVGNPLFDMVMVEDKYYETISYDNIRFINNYEFEMEQKYILSYSPQKIKLQFDKRYDNLFIV